MRHARLRALERCQGFCPDDLLERLEVALSDGDADTMEFICVMSGFGTESLYRFRLPDGQVRYAIVCTPNNYIITFLRPGQVTNTSRGLVRLHDTYLERVK